MRYVLMSNFFCFIVGCCVTRRPNSCLELICEKWSHSLLEVDLAWSTVTQSLNAAVEALAEKGQNSVLRLILCIYFITML